MPIYEFYCKDCHAIYSFFSRRVNTDSHPECPICGRSVLSRQVSMFSAPRNRDTEADDLPADLDEAGLERAMASMSQDLANLDEEDPRQAASVMRRLFDASGLRMGGTMDEAIQRLEAGEDPSKIEADLGDALQDGGLFRTTPRQLIDDIRRKHLPPRVDETLYELDP
ncbi:MAG: zinc ribbon domain-containing protein [Pseudomonadota bacterium]|nr:zinc ribbon domain-containing protein [Pseudomonadota bacterium]